MYIRNWILSTITILIAAYLLPGVTVTVVGALVLAVVLGAINLFIRPIILLLTLPLTLITLGLFSFVINALLILLAARIIPDFSVDGFWTALLFSIVVALLNALLSPSLKKKGT
jgi:putative membrane protein